MRLMCFTTFSPPLETLSKQNGAASANQSTVHAISSLASGDDYA